jgi:hypothetical protein
MSSGNQTAAAERLELLCSKAFGQKLLCHNSLRERGSHCFPFRLLKCFYCKGRVTLCPWSTWMCEIFVPP